MYGNSCSISGDKHLRSMPLSCHVSSPTCKPPTPSQNIRILSPEALCPSVFIPTSQLPTFCSLVRKVPSPLPRSVRQTLKAQQRQQHCSSPVPQDSTATPYTPLLWWERRLPSTPGFEDRQKSFREHAFLMSLCKAGLSEAHNLSKCGKIFTEIGKYTFLTSEGSSAPTADQKTSLSSKLGSDC